MFHFVIICLCVQGQRFLHTNISKELLIPPGADSLYTITLTGLGDEVAFKQPGDVKFVVNVLKDGLYTRNGSDLVRHLDLTLKEALLGWNRCAIT